ncbi:malonyl-[acyl-carrier protein] O-methyltransferase 1 [Elysia marginata]|uniref:Malonyl-[acyl-carrier protein] O-methyltransferase 1 n=1 Tax=Elysia marginata TaxID=1093978 RepID=A0AAV4GCQ6_9GAST|nr:malonyl-[acyl-carrier protein] O-methyltransferase 1 [Elysia marginata]
MVFSQNGKFCSQFHHDHKAFHLGNQANVYSVMALVNKGVRYTDQVQDILDRFSQGNAPFVAQMFLEQIPDLKAQLEKGIDVIEFGAGRGRLSATLAQQFPNSRFVASEVVPNLVEANKERWKSIPNISFSLDDVCSIPDVPEKHFDWVFCCDVIHDLPDPLEALQGIKRMLRKPYGLLTFVDMATSGSPLADRGDMAVATFYTLGTFFCIPESYQRENSLALGPCCGSQTLTNLAQNAGFQVKFIKVEDCSGLFICKCTS